MDSTNVQDDINITIQIPSKLVLVNLNLKTGLSKIREKLEKNSTKVLSQHRKIL
ncbi:hypothetical protein RhiirA5_430824 [Rhizophagus irregularis]|uniref:Uncharacterized protein n=1 Tax=Rhizophagus irregularis TaxID=588596 RepID=A0A2N0NW51_9GLOM|nr:hypothetical protein RhiirA5_430824 [Rhizophagus irregularis]